MGGSAEAKALTLMGLSVSASVGRGRRCAGAAADAAAAQELSDGTRSWGIGAARIFGTIVTLRPCEGLWYNRAGKRGCF